ncbi:MAG: hypothetical protein OEY56_08865 [Cyclobacteriaceae bacterium]|nr:hypothetical protein [Cyclobacteriaceae bacterium]
MRPLLVVPFVFMLLFSCKDRIICPAFQSTYILDDSTRAAYYSYAWRLDKKTRESYLATLSGSDTASRGGTSSDIVKYYSFVEDIVRPGNDPNRTKYGIVRYEPVWLKNYQIKTAPMENIHGPPSEIIEPSINEGEFVASDFALDSVQTKPLLVANTDSLRVDSTAVAQWIPARQKPPKPTYLYKYDPNGQNNAEQEYYNKYFGELLVDRSPAKQTAKNKLNPEKDRSKPDIPVEAADSTSQQKRSKLFQKKNVQEGESGEASPEEPINN